MYQEEPVYSRPTRERNQVRFLSLDLHVDADVGGFMRFGCNLIKSVSFKQYTPYLQPTTIRCRPAPFQIIHCSARYIFEFPDDVRSEERGCTYMKTLDFPSKGQAPLPMAMGECQKEQRPTHSQQFSLLCKS